MGSNSMPSSMDVYVPFLTITLNKDGLSKDFIQKNPGYVCRWQWLKRSIYDLKFFRFDDGGVRSWNCINASGMNPGPWRVSPEVFGSTWKSGIEIRCHPIEPSISNSRSRLSSTAYSIGSSRVNGSKNPLTIIPMASFSLWPLLIK